MYGFEMGASSPKIGAKKNKYLRINCKIQSSQLHSNKQWLLTAATKGLGKKMAKNTHESNPSIKIPLDFILEDFDFNCRKVEGEGDEYEDIEMLAKQIKADGQLSPVMVRKIPEDQMEEGQLETYELVFGFRRMAAIRLLGRDSIMAQVWDGSDEDMYFVNLAENVSRKNLKPWKRPKDIPS